MGSGVDGGEASVLAAAAHLVWLRRRLMWRVYGVHLLLAFLGTLPAAVGVSRILDHSLAAQGLLTRFDAALFAELLAQPEASLAASVSASAASGLLFLLAMLFLTGGILTAYLRDHALTAAEFYGASGAHFWRFARLSLMLLLALVPVGIVGRLLGLGASRVAETSAQETAGLWASAGVALVVAVLLMAVRLLFGMAQVRAVAEAEPAMRRALAGAFRVTRGRFFELAWIYLRISLVAAAGLGLILFVWVSFVRPQWVAASFLLGQAGSIVWIATRLWQRAAETVWYRRRFPASA